MGADGHFACEFRIGFGCFLLAFIMKRKLFVGLFFIFLASCQLLKDVQNDQKKREAILKRLKENFFGEDYFELDTIKIKEK